jgi:pimeloyl-ACP methyl ester carboxylesterase
MSDRPSVRTQPHAARDEGSRVREGTHIDGNRLETRLGPVAWRSSGEGPPIVFFAGALANGDLWRDVVVALGARHRCVTIDLPLGAHPWPLVREADRSATSLARLLLDCLELLEVDDATVVANDTAGGLLLLSLATGHPALSRVGRLVLTNCENYDQFPPDALRMLAGMCRRLPRLARALVRLQLRSSALRRKMIASVSASELDNERAESFFGPARRDRRIVDDLVAAFAGFRPQLLLDAAEAIPQFDQPVLLVWGESCDFFPMTRAQRLASDFPATTLVSVPGAKTWVPVDKPVVVADAIAKFVPIR